MSFEAKRLFETWQHELVDAQRSEDALGLQLVYPKIESYTARLALWLHLVNAVLRQEQPSQVISGKTMEKAIELAAYYLWQHRLNHTHNSPDSGLAAIGLKIQKFAERVGEVTASRLKSGIRALRKMATDQIRQLMKTLANTGYGSIRGEGAEMTYVPVPGDRQLQLDLSPPSAAAEIDTVDVALTTMSGNETSAKSKLNSLIDTIDTTSSLSRDEASSELTTITGSPNELPHNSSTIQHLGQSEISQDSASNDQIDSEPHVIFHSSISSDPSITGDSYSSPLLIQVGDICRYTGSALRNLKGLDQLLIEEVDDGIATVRASGWYISHKVPLSDLIKQDRKVNNSSNTGDERCD